MRVLLLAYYHPRHMRPLKQWAAVLRENGHEIHEMYPDEYYKQDVLRELGNDYDLVVYFGHGVPTGWAGFGHISLQDLANLHNPRSDRIVLSLSCYSLHSTDENIGSVLLDNAYAGLVAGYREAILYEENRQNLDTIMRCIVTTGQILPLESQEGVLSLLRQS